MARRFIILTQARCGSELLVNLLDDHPQVTCLAELFSHVTGHPERFNTFLDRLPKAYDRTDPKVLSALAGAYLDAVFAADEPRWTGFKLLVEQMDRHPYVADHLFGRSGDPVSVIRLIRKNELKVLLSREGARQRNMWHTTGQVDRVPVEMPVGETLLACLRAIREANKRILETAPDHRGMVVAYEDLLRDREGTVRTVQAFLDVPAHAAQSPLKKITSDSLSQAMANYPEVEATLAGTRFARCLDTAPAPKPKPAPRRRIISFVHIPKTGGSSLETIFKKNYRRDEILMAYGPHDGPVEQFPALPRDRRRRLKVVTGHYTMGQSLRSLPPETHHISILRHPVDRLLSSYYMYYHHENHPEGIRIRENNITLEQFADPAYGFGVDNVQTKYIAGVPPQMPCTARHLHRALAVLNDKITVCGILERFKETVFLCSKLFGWDDINFTHVGYNAKRPHRKDLDPAQRPSVLRHNVFDLELYSRGLELFEESMQTLAPYGDELAAYLESEQAVTRARHYHPWRNADGTLKEQR